jgi:ATP-dependent RNA helicase DDX56/DBP9
MSEFCDLWLDPRLLQALVKLDFSHPTLVQRSVIPLALQGKDILARARTGSGKTVAYLLPIIHKILAANTPANTPAIMALILVPTRELAHQIDLNITELTRYCSEQINKVNLSVSDHLQTQMFFCLIIVLS